MANFVFNIAKGRTAHYATLPAATDSMIVVPLQSAGLEADAILVDKDTLADVLAGATDEQTTMGRKTLTNVTVTVDDAQDRVDIDMDDVTWASATGNAISALVFCYVPASGSSDNAIVPMFKYDFVTTPNGGTITAVIPTNGLCRLL